MCRVDLSRYPGPGRYRGIRANTLTVSRHVWAEVRVHEHVDAWKYRCQQHVDGHTWTAGSEPTGVAHGIVSTRRMGRGPREGILLPCPVWVSWFDEDVEP